MDGGTDYTDNTCTGVAGDSYSKASFKRKISAWALSLMTLSSVCVCVFCYAFCFVMLFVLLCFLFCWCQRSLIMWYPFAWLVFPSGLKVSACDTDSFNTDVIHGKALEAASS